MSIFNTGPEGKQSSYFSANHYQRSKYKLPRKKENAILNHWKTGPSTYMWLFCLSNGLRSLFRVKLLFLQWKDY